MKISYGYINIKQCETKPYTLTNSLRLLTDLLFYQRCWKINYVNKNVIINFGCRNSQYLEI